MILEILQSKDAYQELKLGDVVRSILRRQAGECLNSASKRRVVGGA